MSAAVDMRTPTVRIVEAEARCWQAAEALREAVERSARVRAAVRGALARVTDAWRERGATSSFAA